MPSRRPCWSPGIAIHQWGPAAWNTLHAIAHCAPDDLAGVDWRAFLDQFASMLPCPKCRTHFCEWLDNDRRRPATREELVRLLNDAHNAVNARLGKPTWTLAEHNRVYGTARCQPPPPPRSAVRPYEAALPPLILLLVVAGVGAAAAALRRRRRQQHCTPSSL